MLTIKQKDTKSWVTFTFAPAEGTQTVSIFGEWNDWKEEPMKKKKSGEFYITKVLKTGKSFQFGYKADENGWFTEAECSTVTSPFAGQNSLLQL